MSDRPKILIVDDDVDLLATLRSICDSLNCETHVAKDGREALDRLSSEEFTLVLSDVRMPRMDGMSLLENLMKMGNETPVVVMTGYSDYSAAQIDEKNGVVLLEKPFTRKSLQEVIEQFIPLLNTGS